MQAHSARNLSSMRLNNAEMDNLIGKEAPGEERTIATEFTVPNMSIKGQTGILKMLHIPRHPHRQC